MLIRFRSLAVASVVALAALGAACGADAQDAPRSPIEVAQAFERRFNAADLDGLTRLYAPGSVFVPAPGVALTEPGPIRGALQQFLDTKLPMRIAVRQVYSTGQTALVVFDWTLEGNGPDGKPMKLAGTGADVVARQADGTWLYAIDNPFGVAQPAQ